MSPTPDPGIRCDACRFYAATSRYGRAPRGECRYRAPRTGGDCWPSVRPDDWRRRWIPHLLHPPE